MRSISGTVTDCDTDEKIYEDAPWQRRQPLVQYSDNKWRIFRRKF